jgi:MoxR-like ATPase
LRVPTNRDLLVQLRDNVNKAIVGQNEIVTSLIAGLLANGNILVEGLPGLAKTRAVKALASHIDCTFGRIQFTPDLQSRDITGYYDSRFVEGDVVHTFEKGPIFNNIVLADEVNRAPAKVQNSLLEAMEERQVTVGGTTYKMPDLFLVMATMNPIEQEGTFKLPEAQKDRFLMHVNIDYPDEEAEEDIIRLVRSETRQDFKKSKKAEIKDKLDQKIIFEARGEIDDIKVDQKIEKYIVDIIFATRYPQRYSYDLKAYVKLGASPRASLGIDRSARAHAWLEGRDHVAVEDVRAVLKPVLRHRIVRAARAFEHNTSTDDIIQHLIEIIMPADGAPYADEKHRAADEAREKPDLKQIKKKK